MTKTLPTVNQAAGGGKLSDQEYYTHAQYIEVFNKKVQADALNGQILNQISSMK